MLIFCGSFVVFFIFFHCSQASYQELDDNDAFNDMSRLLLNNFNPIQPENLVQSISGSCTPPIKHIPNPFSPPTQSTFFQLPRNSSEPRALYFDHDLFSQPNSLFPELLEPHHSHPLSSDQIFQNNPNFNGDSHIPSNQFNFENPNALFNKFDLNHDQMFQNQQLLGQVPQNHQSLNQDISQADPNNVQNVSQIDSDDDIDGNGDNTEFLHKLKSKKVRGKRNIEKRLKVPPKLRPTDPPKYRFVGANYSLGTRELTAIKICAPGDTVVFEKNPKPGYNQIFYECALCGRIFNRKRHYRDHADAHRNIRRYKCNLCPQQFNQVSALNRHKKKHREGFRFKCDSCSLCFRTKSDQITHEKTCVDPTK